MMKFVVIWYDGNETHATVVTTDDYRKGAQALGLPGTCEQITAMVEIDELVEMDEPVVLDDLRVVVGLRDV